MPCESRQAEARWASCPLGLDHSSRWQDLDDNLLHIHQTEVDILFWGNSLSSLLIWLHQWLPPFHSFILKTLYITGRFIVSLRRLNSSKLGWNSNSFNLIITQHHHTSPLFQSPGRLGTRPLLDENCLLPRLRLLITSWDNVLIISVNTCSSFGEMNPILGSSLSCYFQTSRIFSSHITRSLEIGGCWLWISYGEILEAGIRISKWIFPVTVLILRGWPRSVQHTLIPGHEKREGAFSLNIIVACALLHTTTGILYAPSLQLTDLAISTRVLRCSWGKFYTLINLFMPLEQNGRVPCLYCGGVSYSPASEMVYVTHSENKTETREASQAWGCIISFKVFAGVGLLWPLWS